MDSTQRATMMGRRTTGQGWDKIIAALDETLTNIDPNYSIAQIKEKFGTLRFYFGTQQEDKRWQMIGAVQMAEAMSAITCEDCGEQGIERDGNWIRTLCDNCAILVATN